MAKCEQCGIEVFKLFKDKNTKRNLCIECVDKLTFYPLTEHEIKNGDERRVHMRIPLMLGFSFSIGGSKRIINYSGETTDISMSGMCVAWKECEKCTGFKERKIHKKCFFYPYSTFYKKASPLSLKLSVAPQIDISVKGVAVYVMKEKNKQTEYVGIKFTEFEPKSVRLLEMIIVKYGGNE